ncbi:MAG: hypothetical protein QME49_05385 [bacterium]|nr:hypothetical protein [bacterium]
MARKPSVEYPGALYHVIARGNRRRDIFLEDEDSVVFSLTPHFPLNTARYSYQVIWQWLLKHH